MLETMLDGHIIIVLMGILTAVGIMSKCIANIALKRLIRAAGNMNKSTHPLMRLVRAKFEHVSMVSDKVENVGVFVDKYLYEYKVLGLKLHSWRRMEKTTAGLCLLVGAAGAGVEYGVNGMNGAVWKMGALGGGLAAGIFLVHLLTDEKYQMEAIRNYMVDYLENICLHKYEKASQKEIKILAQEGMAADFASMPAEERENARELYETRDQERTDGLAKANRQESSREPYEAGTRGASEEPYATRKREPVKGQSAVSAFLAAELKAGELGTEEAAGTYHAARNGTDDTVGGYRTARNGTDETAGGYRTARNGTDETAGGYRTARNGTDETAGGYRTAMQGAGETEGAYRTAKAGGNENAEVYQTMGLEAGEVTGTFRVAEPGKNDENIVEIPKADPVREALAAAVSDTAEYSAKPRNSMQRQPAAKEKKARRERPSEDVDRDIVIRRILEEFMA